MGPGQPGSVCAACRLPRQSSRERARRRSGRRLAALPHPAHPPTPPPAAEQAELELYRLHNSSLKFGGHLIRAKVLDMDRKKIVVDTGLRTAKIGLADLTPECIVGTTVKGNARRQAGEVRIGDVVQVYLEHEETPEGDMLVSGQQAAKERRFQAVWKELRDRMQGGQGVKGEFGGWEEGAPRQPLLRRAVHRPASALPAAAQGGF